MISTQLIDVIKGVLDLRDEQYKAHNYGPFRVVCNSSLVPLLNTPYYLRDGDIPAQQTLLDRILSIEQVLRVDIVEGSPNQLAVESISEGTLKQSTPYSEWMTQRAAYTVSAHSIWETCIGKTWEVGPFIFCSNECRENWIKEDSGITYRRDVQRVTGDSTCDMCNNYLEVNK